jgi:hypothetical protein
VRIWLLVCSFLTMFIVLGAAPPDESVLLGATDDTYDVADISAPDDPQGLRDKNFGGLDFLKIWYVSQVQATEQIVSIGLVRFDLSSIKDRDVRSAHLQLFATRADLLQPARLVDVSLAEGAWTEMDANFKNLPQVSTPPLASAAVYGANVWYSWDVTPAAIRKLRDGTVTFAIGLRTLESRGEEQVIFASREAGRNAPRLVVTAAPATPAIPLIAWPIGIVVAAVLAFGAGILVARRRRAPRATVVRAAVPTPVSPPAEELDDIIECPSCRRQIPASAETCPRCGARIPVGPPSR